MPMCCHHAPIQYLAHCSLSSADAKGRGRIDSWSRTMDIKSKQTVPMTVSLPESSLSTTWTTSEGPAKALLQLRIVELSSTLTCASWASAAACSGRVPGGK